MEEEKKKKEKKKSSFKRKKAGALFPSVQKKITFIMVYLTALENEAVKVVCIFLGCHGSAALAPELEIPWSGRRAKAARPGSVLGGTTATAPL